ncbi:hypothetical protein V6N11_003831 [Hibiscus sabdariffa]|uniref:Uncharacterized protein n=1 Tax=Hibiscus sabdariffa TaxID=183260 RepID=A0ABR2SEC6_9ROSI
MAPKPCCSSSSVMTMDPPSNKPEKLDFKKTYKQQLEDLIKHTSSKYKARPSKHGVITKFVLYDHHQFDDKTPKYQVQNNRNELKFCMPAVTLSAPSPCLVVVGVGVGRPGFPLHCNNIIAGPEPSITPLPVPIM